jgi:hypothetical protein
VTYNEKIKKKDTDSTFNTGEQTPHEKKIPPLVLSTRGFIPKTRRRSDTIKFHKQEFPETCNITRQILNNSANITHFGY